MKLFGRCFPGLLTNEYGDALRRYHEQITEEFHFVIPRKDLKRFLEIRPQEGAILTVSQFMFLYKYFTLTMNEEEPAPDYERVFYFFHDRSSTFLLKGWVPTASCPEEAYVSERKLLLNNINNNLKFYRNNGTEQSVYLKAGKTSSVASKIPNSMSQGLCHSVSELELESDSRMLPTMFTAAMPQRKSTYNWGIINTWSRHMAPESEDLAPLDLFKSSKQTVLRTESTMNQLEELNKDILSVIEGKSAGHLSRKPKKPSGMVLSTIEARGNRMPRTPSKNTKMPQT